MCTICIVCDDFYKKDEEVKAMQCGHIFHKKCLLEWVKKSPTCPKCFIPYYPMVCKTVFLDFDQYECTDRRRMEFLEAQLRNKNVELDEMKNENERKDRDIKTLSTELAGLKMLSNKNTNTAKKVGPAKSRNATKQKTTNPKTVAKANTGQNIANELNCGVQTRSMLRKKNEKPLGPL